MQHIGLTQLIPGNPGTSFVVALLFAAQQKYGRPTSNQEQLQLFTQGILASRAVFFSGVCGAIARVTGKTVTVTSNNKSLLRLAATEIDPACVTLKHSVLNMITIRQLLRTQRYLVLSVDLFAFSGYHDYHFVCLAEHGDGYEIFEPKQGVLFYADHPYVAQLVRSVPDCLNDTPICFML